MKLLLFLLLGCSAKTGEIESAAAPEAIDGVAPVYFQSGTTDLSSDMDVVSVGQAIERLQQNPGAYLLLAGYADSTGDPVANEALSLERARRVQSMLIERSGIDPSRVLVTALGAEYSSSGDLQQSRRVEFHFYQDRIGSPPDVATILADAGITPAAPPSAGASVSASAPVASAPPIVDSSGDEDAPRSRGSKDEGEEKNIMPTGLAEFDAFFNQVQPLLDSLRTAARSIDEASTNLNTAMGLAADADPGEALRSLAEQAAGSIQVKMNGTTPEITFSPTATPQVQQGVGAVKGLVQALSTAVASLAQLPTQAQALVAQAKALPGQVPGAVKSAGLSVAEMGPIAKAVKNNVSITASIPSEATEVLKSAQETLTLIASAFT